MVPIALGLVVGSGSSLKLVPKLGAPTVLMMGLLVLASVLSSALLWSPEMAVPAARVLVLRPGPRDGLDHGPGDELGDGLRAGGEGRSRVGDERRHPPGRRARSGPR